MGGGCHRSGCRVGMHPNDTCMLHFMGQVCYWSLMLNICTKAILKPQSTKGILKPEKMRISGDKLAA